MIGDIDFIDDKGVLMVLCIDVGDGNSLRENDRMMWFGEREGVRKVAVIPCEECIGSMVGRASDRCKKVGSVCG
jgi:hypothetical protein